MSIKSFLANRRGNTAVMFGFAAFGLAAAVGGSIDLGRMLVARSSLQDAADAAVLRAATMSSGTSNSAQEAASHQAFTSNLSGELKDHITDKKLARDTDGVNTSLTYTASAHLPTYLLQLVKIDYFDLSVVSEAKAQMRKSEIVFVLDVTGSMKKNDRIGNLKTSVVAVLDSLVDKSEQNLTGTKVGIVPFDEQVRVDKGTSYSWVDYGKATNSQGCSNISGSYCTMMIDAVERACMKTSDPLACKATAKLYTKTYQGTASGETNRTYFEVFVKVYSSGSNQSNTYTEKSYETYKTTTSTGSTNCSKETGSCTTTAGGKETTSTTRTFVSQSGTTTTGKSGYDSMTNVPAGFGQSSGKLVYNVSYGNGYGEIDPRNVTSTTNGLPKTTYFPAVEKNLTTWKGCIIDREKPYDISADSPDTAASAKYPARDCKTSTLDIVKPLTTNIPNMRDYVNALKIGGDNTFTNITIGVQWGMEVLSPSEPMPGGVPFNDEITSKYMILVTDGENNQNRWTSNTAEIDKRTKAACEAARAKGITVFVIRLMEGDSELLEGCASKTEYYYDLQQATELGAALKDVFEAIKKTRLTK